MRNLSIDKGYKEYTINNDENAVIRVKTTDFSLIDKLLHVKDNIAATVAEIEERKQSDSLEKILAALDEADRKVKAELDRVFDGEVSAVVFGNTNCLSFSGGQPVALNFLEAIMPEIKRDLAAEQNAANEKISKYTDAAKQFS